VGVIKLVAQPGAFKESYDSSTGEFNCQKYAVSMRKELSDRIKMSGMKTNDIVNQQLGYLEKRVATLENLLINLNKSVCELNHSINK